MFRHPIAAARFALRIKLGVAVGRDEAEVPNLDLALGVEEDVGWLEVSVDETLRVDVLHPQADLPIG